MNAIEEIKKIKSQLDSGTITDDEFQRLKKEILSKSNIDIKPIESNMSQPVKEELIGKDNSESKIKDINQEKTKVQKEEFKPSNNQISVFALINPANIVTAGRSIKKSVLYSILNAICGVICTILLFVNGLGTIATLYNGGEMRVEKIYAPFIFIILALIFWIASLASLYTAGRLLEKSIKSSLP